MTVDTMKRRLSDGEDATVEFVRDLRSPGLIARTVCAFMNGEGGTIYCGVDKKGKAVGISGDAEAVARKLEFDLKKLISPSALFTATAAAVDDRELVIVDVPQGKDRPYVVEGGVWLRRGAATKPADITTLKAMLREQADTPERWERRLSPSMTMDDLDIDEVRITVREAEELQRFDFSDRRDDLAVLMDLAVYSGSGFTQGGDVLFSRAPSRRHPQCRVQYVRFAGDKADDVYQDNRTFDGPLVRVCNQLIEAISAASPMRSVFVAGEARRLDQPAYDLTAVREGIVNAFVHRDYSAYSGGLRVSVYGNRIEIWNSGRLPEGLTPGALRREHPSILINPDIAQVFHLRDLMERIGRGTEKIVKASKRIGAPPPQWRDSPTGVTLTLFAATPTASGKSVELNERQNQLLLDLQPGETISPREYQERYAAAVSARQARRDLEELEGLGWLRREGQTRSIVYRLP